MKKMFLPLLLLSIGISVSSCTSSETEGNLNKEIVLGTLEQFDNAIITRDAGVLSSIASQELTYGHSSGNIQDREEFIDDVVNGTFEFLTISNEDQSVHISGNVAIVRHILSADALNNGIAAQVHIGVVMVFKLDENGHIVLLARQAYKL
ncbi:nuclear transport factor 2 family protein [Flagellimonas oceanensis]|uniref:nuclear transport factor 2 family protein n=1 Tax=Flagellimonas oceanensis TaxID=2499163 RepID=UPI003BA9F9AA